MRFRGVRGGRAALEIVTHPSAPAHAESIDVGGGEPTCRHVTPHKAKARILSPAGRTSLPPLTRDRRAHPPSPASPPPSLHAALGRLSEKQLQLAREYEVPPEYVDIMRHFPGLGTEVLHRTAACARFWAALLLRQLTHGHSLGAV